MSFDLVEQGLKQMSVDNRPSPRKLLTKQEVLGLVRFSYTSLWSMMRRQEFPRSVVLGRNKIGWYEDEVAAWIEARPRQALKGDRPLANQRNPREWSVGRQKNAPRV